MSQPDTSARDSLDTLPNPNAADDAAASLGEGQGEGNVEADRRYREGVKKTIASGEVEQLAEEASRALDGDEAAELQAAEEKGRNAETPTAGRSQASRPGAAKNGT